MNDLDDRKSFVLTKSKDTFNRYKLHGNVRTNDFCDTTTTTMLHKTHFVLIGRKNKARAKNFIGKLDFVWNVNLLKCVQCFLSWSQNGRCKRWFSMFIRFIYCIRFQLLLSVHPSNIIDSLKSNDPQPLYEMMLIIPMVIQSMNIICLCNLCVHSCN